MKTLTRTEQRQYLKFLNIGSGIGSAIFYDGSRYIIERVTNQEITLIPFFFAFVNGVEKLHIKRRDKIVVNVNDLLQKEPITCFNFWNGSYYLLIDNKDYGFRSNILKHNIIKQYDMYETEFENIKNKLIEKLLFQIGDIVEIKQTNTSITNIVICERKGNLVYGVEFYDKVHNQDEILMYLSKNRQAFVSICDVIPLILYGQKIGHIQEDDAKLLYTKTRLING